MQGAANMPKETDATLLMYADAIEQLLENRYNWDFENPSVANTPVRFLKYLDEFHQPVDFNDLLGAKFKTRDNSMVIQSNIPFRGMCEHHLAPMIGKAAVGYVPNGWVVGLSKMTRLVQSIGTEKPSLQEHISDRIANMLTKHIEPLGVMVVIEAEHMCMACRGVNSPDVFTTSSTIRGCFKSQPSARAEFLALANIRRSI